MFASENHSVHASKMFIGSPTVVEKYQYENQKIDLSLKVLVYSQYNFIINTPSIAFITYKFTMHNSARTDMTT